LIIKSSFVFSKSSILFDNGLFYTISQANDKSISGWNLSNLSLIIDLFILKKREREKKKEIKHER